MRFSKKEGKIVEVLYKVHHHQTLLDTGFSPIGLDEPYRVIISEDPIGFEGGDVNFFAYVRNNPMKFRDPSGLWSVWGGAEAGVAVGQGSSLGAGWAFDSNNGGWGTYTTIGKVGGFTAGGGLQGGIGTGSMDGPSVSFTLGWGVGFGGIVINQDGNVGVFGGVSVGVPFTADFSINDTGFFPFRNSKHSHPGEMQLTPCH